MSDGVVAAQVNVHGIDHDALVQNNGLFYELADAADTCQAVDSVTIFYRDGSSDTIPDDMIGWAWQSPDADTEPARDNVDGLGVEPIASPPDVEPPPRCWR